MRAPNALILVLIIVSIVIPNPAFSFQRTTWRDVRKLAFASKMSMTIRDHAEELARTASFLVSPGKGILAADESTNTIGKRLKGINVENTEENRRKYRELLFTTPRLAEYISGVILYEEALYQQSYGGQRFVDILRGEGMIPGIKVDTGLKPLPGADPIETWCTGIDGLKERAAVYYANGARFAKWRAVFQITETCPTPLAIQENAWGIARYARAVQESGLVPIVEPEILMDGDHTVERAAEVQERVLSTVYKALNDNGVFLEGSLLKPSMTLPGLSASVASPEDVAKFTIRTLERTVPVAVPGVTFLSGGLSEEDASVYLDAINRVARQGPWAISFSFGRALQYSCLRAWNGQTENTTLAQKALLARARANAEASLGKYPAGSQSSTQSHVVASESH